MRNKTKLIIIAGPQSSGKTTVFNLLQKKYPKLTFIPEINPYTIAGKTHMGAPFVTGEMEIKIAQKTLEILNEITKLDRPVIMETGIMHLVWLEESCGAKTAEKYFDKNLKLHKQFHNLLVFIDTLPSVSFLRRKKIYLERIKKAGVNDPAKKNKLLKKYQEKIRSMYPYFLKWYKKIPFSKIMIENSDIDYDSFINESLKLISDKLLKMS